MNRREASLALAAVAALPLAAGAQQPEKVYRIGFLGTDPTLDQAWGNYFGQALAGLGWIVGRNIAFENRYSEGKSERLPDLAAELVRLNVDLLLVEAAAHTEAARLATKSIPIVFIAHGDPVGRGHVASLAKPGGNITGGSQMLPELCAKRLELLKAVAPRAVRVAVLWNGANPAKAIDLKASQDAARALALTLESVEVRGPNDFQAAFDTIRERRVDALMTLEDPLTFFRRAATVEFAASASLPAIYASPGYVEIGGLMSYAISTAEFARMAAIYVDKILRGAKPADLPVQQPTTVNLALNLKTAKALNLTIPQSVMVRADFVIG